MEYREIMLQVLPVISTLQFIAHGARELSTEQGRMDMDSVVLNAKAKIKYKQLVAHLFTPNTS
jgi:hypothetical protein